MNKKNINQQKINEKGILDVLEQKVKIYKKHIIFAICLIFAVVAIAGFVSHLKNKAYQKQWGELFLAELPIALQTDPTKIDLTQLEAYAIANETTNAGVYAALTLGNGYYQKKDYAKAEEYFKQTIKNANEALKPIAESSLIATYIAKEDYTKAIEQADAFLAKYPNHFILAQVKTHKALATELSGKTQEAKALYTEIIEQYPNSYSSALAELQSAKIK